MHVRNCVVMVSLTRPLSGICSRRDCLKDLTKRAMCSCLHFQVEQPESTEIFLVAGKKKSNITKCLDGNEGFSDKGRMFIKTFVSA